MQDRRRRVGMRDTGRAVPDSRPPMVRRPVAEHVRGLDAQSEAKAMAWIEDVSEFDERAPG